MPVTDPRGQTDGGDESGSREPDAGDTRGRGGPNAAADEPGSSDTGDPGRSTPGQDTPGFLRREALPMMARLIRRLELSGHAGTVQDLLDLSTTPALRLLIWPRTPLLDGCAASTRATLEVEVAGVREPAVTVQYWRGPEKVSVVHVARLPADALSASWLWDRLLDGLETVLGSA